MFKVTIRVVETMCNGTNISFTDLCESTALALLERTGGATVDQCGTGMWRNAQGIVVKELGANVWTLCSTRAEVDYCRGLAQYLRVSGNQDVVMFTVQDVRGEFV